MTFIKNNPPLRLSIIYFFITLCWILFSDELLLWITSDRLELSKWQSIKGAAFVTLSSLLLYYLIKIETNIIRRTNERLEHTMRVSPALLYSLKADPTLDGKLVLDYLSPAVKQLSGYSTEDWMIPGFWLGHVHPDDRPAASTLQEKLLKEGSLKHQYRFLHGDGSYRQIEDHLILRRNSEGKPAAIFGAWLDVTDRAKAEQLVKDTAANYQLLFTSNPMPMWVYNLETLAFIAVNDAAIAHYGYTKEEFLGMTIADIRPPDDVPHLHATVQKLVSISDNYSDSGLWRHCKKDGSQIQVEITGHNLEFEGHHARMILANDVTKRIEAEQQVILSSKVFEFSGEGIIITDAGNNVISTNRAYSEISGYTPDEVLGKKPHLVVSEGKNKAFYQAMWHDILTQGRWQGEVINRRKNGERYPQWLSISAIRDQDGHISQHVSILSDISEHKTALARIQFLSNFDPLTQLPNRALLRDRAQLLLTGAKRDDDSIALMYIDLDRFKIVNDSLGPNVGDQVLKELANRLAGQLHPDITLCHQGGDEFILLLPDTNAEGAAHVAKKMLDITAQPFAIDGQSLTLTASIGIAEFPQDGDNFEQLSQSADAALHRAKQAGRNNFQFFTQQMHDQAIEVMLIENELRRALEQREFLLYYQPQVDAKTLKIVGAEALIRWQHPQKGLVKPARFIPIAEESGLIIEMGDWALNTAVQQAVAWQAAGLAIVPVAINLSVVQFRQDTLYQSVSQALRTSKLDPAMLELELTESVAIENSERTISVLEQLHALGVGLSIDDFGTGYSSLSYLKRFKINKLKIDQSFVRDLGNDLEDAAIVTAIIGMAKALGFKTVAEGVETQDQLNFLQEKQCDEIQGYFFSKPLRPEAFAELLRNSGVLSKPTKQGLS